VPELTQAVRVFVMARRQARRWDAIGEEAIAARLRIASKKYLRRARWLKSISAA
jgi:hypothetical protein